MAIQIVEGKHGLFYGTETSDGKVFVAAKSEEETRRLVQDAAEGRLGGTVVAPPAQDQTPEQRKETIEHLTKHVQKQTH